MPGSQAAVEAEAHSKDVPRASPTSGQPSRHPEVASWPGENWQAGGRNGEGWTPTMPEAPL